MRFRFSFLPSSIESLITCYFRSGPECRAALDADAVVVVVLLAESGGTDAVAFA